MVVKSVLRLVIDAADIHHKIRCDNYLLIACPDNGSGRLEKQKRGQREYIIRMKCAVVSYDGHRHTDTIAQ